MDYTRLGIVSTAAGNLPSALRHYQEAVRYYEAAGDQNEAGQIRFMIAYTLVENQRFTDALPYAEEALRNFAASGARATTQIEQTQRLIRAIRATLAKP